MSNLTLYGPFSQILSMSALPKRGPIKDEQLEVIHGGGILVQDGKIYEVLSDVDFKSYAADAQTVDASADDQSTGDSDSEESKITFHEIKEPAVLMPGLIDSHTHICFGGSRYDDYAKRLAGKTYIEIAKEGGGILSTVSKTREASKQDLEAVLLKNTIEHFKRGITTCEVKSGYGLSIEDEIKMLEAISAVNNHDFFIVPDLIPTCLAAHTIPPEFKQDGGPQAYLELISKKLLPKIKEKDLSKRIDIFIEEGAFDTVVSLPYLRHAKELGFAVTIHADQFSTGGSDVACQIEAISADHLEASTNEELEKLAKHKIIGTVLPGASMGLGMDFAPARRILDHNICMVIASDWNPGSAPMGDLLMQAAVLGAQQKLSNAEVLSAITNRAAMALDLNDRGLLEEGKRADMIAFGCDDYREILYNQGALKPYLCWKNGHLLEV